MHFYQFEHQPDGDVSQLPSLADHLKHCQIQDSNVWTAFLAFATLIFGSQLFQAPIQKPIVT